MKIKKEKNQEGDQSKQEDTNQEKGEHQGVKYQERDKNQEGD